MLHRPRCSIDFPESPEHCNQDTVIHVDAISALSLLRIVELQVCCEGTWYAYCDRMLGACTQLQGYQKVSGWRPDSADSGVVLKLIMKRPTMQTDIETTGADGLAGSCLGCGV